MRWTLEQDSMEIRPVSTGAALGREATTEAPYALGFHTLDVEGSVDELPIRGKVPSWLTGSLVRVAPAKFEVGKRAYNHWFDGLAMLHQFAFAGGRVSYASRYLRSEAYLEAIEKGTISRSEFATDPCRTLFQRVAAFFFPKITDNCNVNVARLADRVVALTETRLPVRFDPETLQSLGHFDYDASLKGPVSTAHPHHDQIRGCAYSYMLDFGFKSRYRLFAIDQKTGRQTVVANIPIGQPAYMHSFAMTQQYLVLAEFPLVVHPLRLAFSGRPFIQNYRWEPERGVRFHVVEKDSGRVVRTASGDPFFAFHHVNAFEDGDSLVIDVVVHADAAIIDQFYLDGLRSAKSVTATGRIARLRLSASGEVTRESLSDTPLELPRFNYARAAGKRHRYVYGVGCRIAGNFLDSLVKLDLDEGAAGAWFEEGCYPGEPVFVPSGGVDEDDGVILSVVLDVRRAASFLLILDAATFRELARADVPHHITFGFHGNYFAERRSSIPPLTDAAGP
jgi:carotenoid cleavage dioxygenase-like enzyme